MEKNPGLEVYVLVGGCRSLSADAPLGFSLAVGEGKDGSDSGRGGSLLSSCLVWL